MRDGWEFVRYSSDIRSTLAKVSWDTRDLPVVISEYLAEKNVGRGSAVRRSRLNPTFAYQIMSGTRHASRNKLIQLAFGLGLDIDESCDLLERGGSSALCPSCCRDAAIAYCLERSLGVDACDDLLWDLGEKTIRVI